MKTVVPPIFLALAVAGCASPVAPTRAQGQIQTPFQTVVSPSSQPEVARQIQEIMGAIDEYADSFLRDHQKPASPYRLKILALHKAVYEEAASQVLNEMVRAPLSPSDLNALKQRLSGFVEPPLVQFEVPFGASATYPAELEARSQKMVQLWNSQGHDLNKERMVWQLRFELSTFFQPLATDAQRAQITAQLTDIGARVEKEFVPLVPGFDPKNLAARTKSQIDAFSAELVDPFDQRMRLLSQEQIETRLTQSQLQAADLAAAMEKNSLNTPDSIGDQVFRVLWEGVLKDMTVRPSSPLLASYPPDLTQRYDAYYRQFSLLTEAARQEQLKQNVQNSYTLDGEILQWLVRAGLEQSNAPSFACDATLTIPVIFAPRPDTPDSDDDGEDEEENAKPAPPVTSRIGLHYEKSAPDDLRITVTSRQAPERSLDFFTNRDHMVIELEGHELTVTIPSLHRHLALDVSQKYNREDIDALNKRGGDKGSRFPLIDPYINDMLAMRAADWSHAKSTSKRLPNGVWHKTEELHYSHPLKVAEPHYLSGIRIVEIPSPNCLLSAQEFDEHGQVVSTTTYSQFHTIRGSAKVSPLHSRTVVAPGAATFSLQPPNSPNPSDKIRGAVQFDGRIITQDYALLKDQTFVLSRLAVGDSKGQSLFQLAFHGFTHK